MAKLVKHIPEQSFSDRVVKIACLIPAGCVTTYGQIATAAGGGSMAARSITAILGKAYTAGNHAIPFHRIVYAGGKIWIDEEHRAKRLKLYKKEGIEITSDNKIKDFQKHLYEFK